MLWLSELDYNNGTEFNCTWLSCCLFNNGNCAGDYSVVFFHVFRLSTMARSALAHHHKRFLSSSTLHLQTCGCSLLNAPTRLAVCTSGTVAVAGHTPTGGGEGKIHSVCVSVCVCVCLCVCLCVCVCVYACEYEGVVGKKMELSLAKHRHWEPCGARPCSSTVVVNSIGFAT